MTEQEERLVGEALRAYPLEGAEVRFIRHNENITCRVTVGRESYALRIHAPVEGVFLALLEQAPSEELMRGEIRLLLHLAEHAPFPVQRPVKNRVGEYITLLAGDIPAQLLQWLPGEEMKREGLGQYAEELGTLAAQIDHAAQGFTGERLRYDQDLVKRMQAELEKAAGLGHLLDKHCALCIRVLDEVGRIMTELDGRPGSRCLIHADLGAGNLLKTPIGLAPIDFSLSGYGHRAQECGMAAFNFQEPEQREQVRRSYEAAGGVEIPRHHLDAFGAFSILLFLSAQHDKVWREDWFREAMARWCETEFARVVE
ncbi:MAG: phosphotransferase [Oscillospiraceae bacterium]|jgi:Ser/Thr protein kinase RdoA (MazF antagonist)|nr:phosphotransferase [Oscillospiraceae bacterium]